MDLYLLVIYDISDNALRSKMASFLKSQGLERIQRSAFIGPATPSLARNVEAGVTRLVRGREGEINVQLYLLTPACFNSRTIIGELKYNEDESGLVT
ncbi:hypothetical protein GCM10007981_10380 [Thermocladium modestius]|uniref:CRISPR-associated endoribonuclease Cas2 n=1 Tax=Thermocladium modestius TaxID=62609 RepID=A0A830GVT4_9CREN|nr:CRISPR-associated endonuclease Cas2 [Thermocladium modestius]GGP20808.1 hypothetical protein GCM10007981_10380 [Thermocladium modestius]